jgi:hypothetical protein
LGIAITSTAMRVDLETRKRLKRAWIVSYDGINKLRMALQA